MIIDWVFPKRCLGCSQNGFYLCPKCKNKIKSLGVSYKNKRLEGQIGLFKYDGVIKELIKTIKFEFVSEAIEEVGNWAVGVLEKDYPNIVSIWKKEKYVIVPVPLHWRRENWRGFNQSVELAKVIGKKFELDINTDLVNRSKHTKSQATQPKSQKSFNVEGAFKVVGKIPLKIIIFDDVWTSGETIKSMLKIIPKKTKVWLLTLCSGG